MSNYQIAFSSKEDPDNQLILDTLAVKKAALILRVFNHKLRQQIMKIIDAEEKVTVTEIYVKLRIEQSVASQHLAILRRAEFVKTTREGKYIYYAINTEKLKELKQFVKDLLS